MRAQVRGKGSTGIALLRQKAAWLVWDDPAFAPEELRRTRWPWLRRVSPSPDEDGPSDGCRTMWRLHLDRKTHRSCNLRLILLVVASVVLLWRSPAQAETTNAPAHVSAALEKSREICRVVEKIRCLSFTNEFQTKVQSPEDFRAYVKKAIARQFGEEGTEGYTKGLTKIGVLKHPVDLTSTILAILEGQAAAYYDPECDTYFLLATNVPAFVFDTISSHELCHALQDQHFDLHAFLEEDMKAACDNGDSSLAKQCLVEGEATLVMMIWMSMQQMGTNNPALAEPIASMGVSCQAAMDFDSVLDLAETGMLAVDEGWGSIGEAMKELENCPRYFVELLFSSYMQGALMVDYVKSKGGWKAVSEIYKNPPESTEQVLHPEKLSGKRDVPVDIRFPGLLKQLPKGWRMVEEDVLGELGIRIFLEIWQAEGAKDLSAAASAAAGWGGDRYYYFANAEIGKDLLVWKTVWDSPEEAAEFAVAYRVALASRFPALKKAWRSDSTSSFSYQVWEVEPRRFLKLMRKNEVVGIIDTTDRARVDVLWK